MVNSNPRVERVLSNNAVLASVGEGGLVLVGRGIGFGRHVGDFVSATSEHRQYLELSPDKAHFLRSIHAMDPYVLETISAGVDLAADLLGELHPSIYLVLAEHLSYALERVNQGEEIRNSLLEEIRAVFASEFAAADLIVQYLNSHLDVSLPIDEAAYLALHLNAARSGTTVKAPLARANELAGLATTVREYFGIPAAGPDLALTLSLTIRRLRAGAFRENACTRSIERDLPREFLLAERLLCRILGSEHLPRAARGEAAFLAVFLHGWRQEQPLSDRQDTQEQQDTHNFQETQNS